MIAERTFDDAQWNHVLADVAGAVAWSPDAWATLRQVAGLIVPRLADWCVIDVRDGESAYRRLAVVHVDARCQARVPPLLGSWMPDAQRPGVPRVVRTGERQVVAEGAQPDALLPRADAECERLIAELGLAGYVSVPLLAHARTLGALTLVTARPGRHFGEREVALAETIARVAALAMPGARLERAPAEPGWPQDDRLTALSHQLRTPLTAMLAWLRLARPGAEAAEVARALDTIERNGRVLGRLIDDLLDTMRVLTGSVALGRRAVDLVEIVEAAVASQAPAARAKGVRLETELDPAAAAYVGDRGRLEQVVAVLVVNAVKFTPPGGRVVARLDGNAALARIRVTDDGRGIPAAHLPYVFDLFPRAADEPGGEGLGLGLTLARGLVELHGGVIEAASDGLDRGATFTVILPRTTSV